MGVGTTFGDGEDSELVVKKGEKGGKREKEEPKERREKPIHVHVKNECSSRNYTFSCLVDELSLTAISKVEILLT